MSTGFVEVADRVWFERQDWFDVNVSVVAGDDALMVIDTFASSKGMRSILERIRAVSPLPVVAVVNTHLHFDHTLGNAVLAGPGVELIAHDEAASGLAAHLDEVRRAAQEELDSEPDADPRLHDLIASTPAPATRTLSSALAVDVGGRSIEIVHPGRGHTSGDVVVRVPDADVLFAGDLVEESAARSAVPGYGDDCHPLAWPLTLDLVTGLLGPGTRVVPGHGAPVDRDFVTEQRAAIGVVAETIRDLAARGVPVENALAAGTWPYPREELATAVRRGYAQLPRAPRHLPLV